MLIYVYLLSVSNQYSSVSFAAGLLNWSLISLINVVASILFRCTAPKRGELYLYSDNGVKLGYFTWSRLEFTMFINFILCVFCSHLERDGRTLRLQNKHIGKSCYIKYFT